MRSIRSRRRNRSRTKLGAAHSCSRAASATSRASSALTLRSGGVTVVAMGTSRSKLSALTGPRSGGDSPRATMRSLAMRHALPLIVALVRTSLAAQTPPPSQPILVKAGRLIDGRSDVARSNVGILIAGDRIKAVGPLAEVQPQAGVGARVIDLAQMTVLPGLIDAHTHLLLQGDPTAASYDEQLLYQSTAYRAILAVRNARIALEHGFTSIRDLETEGAMYADVDVKRAVERGVIPGPPRGRARHRLGRDRRGAAGGREHDRARRRYDRFPHRRARRQGRLLGSDRDRGRVCRRAAGRRVAADGRSPAPGLRAGLEERCPNRVRNGRRRLSLDRAQRGEGVRVLRAVRHDADAGDQVGNVGRRPAAGGGGAPRRSAPPGGPAGRRPRRPPRKRH